MTRHYIRTDKVDFANYYAIKKDGVWWSYSKATGAALGYAKTKPEMVESLKRKEFARLARQTEIEEYEHSVKLLEQMKDIYEGVYLYGGYYTSMMEEINSQIADCKLFIENLKSRVDR